MAGSYKPFIILSSLFLFLIVSVSYIVAIWPQGTTERFFELGVLGKDKKAEGYFPSNTSIITLNMPIKWHIYLSNHVGTDQKVIVKVKLLNSSEPLPDDRRHEPSPIRTIFEIPVNLSANQTSIVPITWSISKIQSQITSQGSYEYIKGMTINGVNIDVDVVSKNNNFNYRIIFELWIYDGSKGIYVFGWNSGKETFSASVYMWFKTRSA